MLNTTNALFFLLKTIIRVGGLVHNPFSHSDSLQAVNYYYFLCAYIGSVVMTVAHLHFPVMTVSTMFFRPFEEHKTTTVDCDHKVFTTHDWGT